MSQKEIISNVKSVIFYHNRPAAQIIAEVLYNRGMTEKKFNDIRKNLALDDTLRIPILNALRDLEKNNP